MEEDEIQPASTPPEPPQQQEPPQPRDTSDRSWQTLGLNPENITKV